MKTLLYNPIFINPQAYYVFPRLTRYLQPDNESTAEPANYIGTIEVKVIAYGDTTLKRTYTNTDSIDLSEFKNTWIRISLFTKVGSCVLGEWKIGNMESDLPYIDPEVLASLKAVVIVGNKTNNDSDRAIVKNLVDPDNPFVISNASYTDGSGYADKDSPYYGAFVTDGIDDLITSTKTVQEMLGGSNEITVMSMIHQIADRGSTYPNIYNNQIRYSTRLLRSTVTAANVVGKTGIYGYTATGVSITGTPTGKVVNDILGDKNDYPYLASAFTGIDAESHFSVEGYLSDSGNIIETSQVAWYWTIIANKVLTTDQINQVIAYFNLDRTLKPDIRCNIERQGITNDNHADFNDKLIDYSGNGRDIQMYNLAWKGGSGIAAKQYETFKDWTNTPYQTSTVTEIDEFTRVVDSTSNAYWVSMINRTSDFDKVHDSINIVLYQDDMLLVHECKYKIDENVTTKALYETLKSGVNTITLATIDKFTDIPEDAEIMSLGEWVNPKSNKGSVKITLLPSYKGGLLLDGVNDFGKAIGMPIYKDYTFIIDYERISYASSEKWVAGVVSKSHVANQGAFILMEANTKVEPGKQAYSFGEVTSFNRDDFTRALLYQSKYKCGDVDLTVGEGVDSDTLWLGTFRDKDQRFFNGAIYSLMSFPYSMSEFLIERQLKKHKLGTLYPNMVEFRPVIKANANYKITYYQIDSTNTWKSIKVGDYIVIGAKLAFQITFDNDASELKEVVSPQLSGIIVEKRPSNPGYNIYSYITSKSPQKINITIDEYIRFEDIVQPYPVLLRFKDENGNEVSWGGKFRVGSTITRIGSAADSNLLPNIYNIFGLLLNGNKVTSSKVIVEKIMVFKAESAYIFDNNEPKCILSPRLLRIPNSSYKILGYIPDISGHGNNGVIHNSAYAEGSGVNEDGSYQFDGVNDHVTIPTVTGGGKQVLMKVNNNTINSMLYDQRSSGASPNPLNNDFAIYSTNTADNNLIAYQARLVGKTYIDGILNTNITCEDLLNVLHNITITCDIVAPNNGVVPYIGVGGVLKDLYSKVALYDFMLFDDISTEDKIKELNEYVGIEAKVELPPYYWDAYGKTNLDADKTTIQQRGVAVGDYDLINYNHAYEGMSGYNGYPIILSGTNRTYQDKASYVNVVGDDKNVINLTRILFNTAAIFSYVKQNGELTSYNKYIESFKIKVTGIDYSRFVIKYSYISEANATAKTTMTIASDGIYELPKSFASDGSLTSSDVWIGINFTKQSNDMPDIIEDVNVTIEVLPEYENGLAYDGVEDYSKNANIPAFTDYTYIYKRTIINIPTNAATLLKGADKTNGGAFIADYGNKWQFNFGQYNIIQGIADGINWQTVNSFNGTSINKGENTDDSGITVAKFSNGYTSMVFYKLILYPKTISLLEINFLKNLMEKDEIIDLNNPIFIQE